MIASYFLSILQVIYHFAKGHINHTGFFTLGAPVFLKTLKSSNLVCNRVRYFYLFSIIFCLFSMLHKGSTPRMFTTVCEKGNITCQGPHKIVWGL